MTPSEVGERAEAAVLAALVCKGKEVLIPFGAHRRYDLIYLEDGKPVKVQCKTGIVRNGVITFQTCSHTGGTSRDYRADVDAFGVYCHERNEVYLVPIEDVPSRLASLRFEPPRNSQRQRIREASRYLVSPGAIVATDADFAGPN